MTMPEQTQVSQSQPRNMQAQRARESEQATLPPVDIYEDGDGLTVLADMPGVSRERLNVRVERNTLFIEGDLEVTLPQQLEGLYADVRASHYQRRFALSDELETEKIQATLKDGVLRVTIPKRPESKPRKIEVQAS
jgi:HSP20 family protein